MSGGWNERQRGVAGEVRGRRTGFERGSLTGDREGGWWSERGRTGIEMGEGRCLIGEEDGKQRAGVDGGVMGGGRETEKGRWGERGGVRGGREEEEGRHREGGWWSERGGLGLRWEEGRCLTGEESGKQREGWMVEVGGGGPETDRGGWWSERGGGRGGRGER